MTSKEAPWGSLPPFASTLIATTAAGMAFDLAQINSYLRVLIHTATISTRRPSANKARIMKLALISMVGVLLCLLDQFQRGFATAPFEFYWARCGVVGTTCSGTVAFAHTPALPGSDELQSRPDLHNGPFLLSQTSPRPTAGFSGFSQRTHSKHRMPRVKVLTEDNGPCDFLRCETRDDSTITVDLSFLRRLRSALLISCSASVRRATVEMPTYGNLIGLASDASIQISQPWPRRDFLVSACFPASDDAAAASRNSSMKYAK